MSPGARPRQGVFISYARADGEAAAQALQQRLRDEAPDLSTWLDRAELEGGVGWWSQIERELDRAEFLVIVLSPAAMRSENTRREWRAARQRAVCIYPVTSRALGGVDADALPRWMRKSHVYDLDAEWPKFVAHLRRGCRATRVPFMAPAPAEGYVERPHEMRALLDALAPGEGGGAPLVALRGPGGYGKTRLAAAACQHEAVVEAFDDGVLWVTLGQSPNLRNALLKLYAALTGERPAFVDTDDATRELALALEGRNCLIVLDDVWRSADARPFLQGAPGCVRLLTTRLADVLPAARSVDIGRMAADEAQALLVARVGRTPEAPAAFERLARRLGGWPLPIKLAASALRQRLERGDSEERALAHVTRALDKRGVVAFDAREGEAADEGAGEVDPRGDAVGRTIALGLGMLRADERRRCCELAIFGDDVAIPLPVAATLWQLDDDDSEDLATRLDGLALLEFDLRHGHLHLHDLLQGYFGTLLDDAAAVHARLVDAWGDPCALSHPYAWRAYARHLRGAGRADALARLLLDPRWLEAKLRATDVQALLADFGQPAAGSAEVAVQAALTLSASALAASPGELRAQLRGRLAGAEEPGVARFVRSLDEAGGAPWWRPGFATLDAPGGLLQQTLAGHRAGVSCLAADPGWTTLVSGARDASVHAWDLGEGRLLAELSRPRLGVRGVALLPQRRALVGSADGTVRVVDLVDGTWLPPLRGADHGAVTGVAAAADGSLAVAVTRDGRLLVWELATQQRLHGIAAHGDRANAVALSADGGRALTGADGGTVRVWDTRAGRLQRSLDRHAADVNAVAITPDGRRGVSGSTDRHAVLWDLDGGARLQAFGPLEASVTAVAMNAEGTRVFAGTADGRACLFDAASGRVLARFGGHSDAVAAIACDAAGARAATASSDGSIKLWRLDAPAAAAAPEGRRSAAVALAVSPDGRFCASGHADGRIEVHALATGRAEHDWPAHAAPLRSLAFSADGSCVLSGAIDGRYSQWSVDADGPVEAFPLPVRHLAAVGYCALAPGAHRLVTSCQDQFVYVWSTPGGTLLARYGTRRLFGPFITPAARRRELPPTDELLDTYLPGETVFDVVIVRMAADGRNAVLSATVRDDAAIRRAAPAPAGDPTGSCLLVFELDTAGVRLVEAHQADPVVAFALDASATRLLWARADHRLELTEIDSGRRLALLEGPTAKVNAVAFDATGTRAYSCGRDRTLRAWSLADGAPIASFTADAALRSLAVAPDGTVIVGDVAGRLHWLRLAGADAPA